MTKIRTMPYLCPSSCGDKPRASEYDGRRSPHNASANLLPQHPNQEYDPLALALDLPICDPDGR
ncbi:MAG: hypothetical protein AAFY57_16480 [Cyanobacteria bacterium J06642_2]